MVSFYWFDYETFGTHPAWDRPCQFAGVRTDQDLNVIGEPMTIYCQQAADYLPQPAACRVTGISPQLANEKGLPEAEFIQKIVNEIGQPGTCSVGYNSIRFDDEFTRHTLFRNLHDPYEQEWKHDNSRWDLIDIVRLTRALRPDGIEWPVDENGIATNRLEHLSALNSIEHGNAHDAMSDVWATIGMAKLIREKQPKLFNYTFAQRGKRQVSELLNTQNRTPCLQVSGMIHSHRHNLAAILPLTQHPQNTNGVIVLDLQHDPRYLLELDADEIARRLFQPNDERNDDDPPRPGLRTVHINKCPVIVPLATLRSDDANRLQLDKQTLLQHAKWAQQLCNERTLVHIRSALSTQWEKQPGLDVDGTLYSGSFLSSADKRKLSTIRRLPAEQLASELDQRSGQFDDPRLNEMVWRYLARSFSTDLTDEQATRWKHHCQARLNADEQPWLSFASFQQAMNDMDWQPSEAALEKSLREYAETLRSA